jgi:peptidoglycan hydrolase CwlO-like protein
VEQQLAGHVQDLQDDAQKLNSQRARAERAMMEAENEIRELLKHSPELASKLATLSA